MIDIEAIKQRFENWPCLDHWKAPLIYEENGELRIKACCQDYLKRCLLVIQSEVQYQKFNSAYGNPFENESSIKIIDAQNLIFNRKYAEAIEILESLLSEGKSNPSHLAQIHISLMQAYFKIRNQGIDFLDKCNLHAKQAMLNGHNTGFAAERLVINLTKHGQIFQAMEVCKMIIGPGYKLSRHGMNKVDFSERLDKLRKKHPEAENQESAKFFTEEEKRMIREMSSKI